MLREGARGPGNGVSPRRPLVDGWTIYLLACRGPSLYVGITRDLPRRLAEHRTGRGGAYTRSHRPLRLVYQEACADHGSALRREAAIRRWPRQRKLTFIAAQ